MTDSAAAVMVRDMIRDCFEDATKVGDDSFAGSMLIEGPCRHFADVRTPTRGMAAFRFVQSGFVYVIAVNAEQLPLRDEAS